MQRVAITGATGYLASLIRLYNQGRFAFVPVSRNDIDYTKPDEVEHYIAALDVDIVFHTAANATTAACENDPAGTDLVNRDSAIAVARACAETGKRMLFISTEQVFNGKRVAGPFDETVEPDSVTRYGQQKAAVDAWMHDNLDDYVTVRLSWMFGLPLPHVKPSPNLVGNVIQALASSAPTRFTANERRCLTYAQRLADQFAELCTLPTGLYHFASANEHTTYEAARIIAERLGASESQIDELILPDTERYANRFRDFRLDACKARSAGIELGTFEEDLELCLGDFGRS
jgi:dTDP-4-dehydrorhamnose reductase